MLKLGSLVKVRDNSGILYLKILNSYKKKYFKHSFIRISDLFVGVVFTINLKKKKNKFKKKNFVKAILVTTKKKYSKNNGFYLYFSENRCIPLKITRFIVPEAIRVRTPIFYELKKKKKFKSVILASKGYF